MRRLLSVFFVLFLFSVNAHAAQVLCSGYQNKTDCEAATSVGVDGTVQLSQCSWDTSVNKCVERESPQLDVCKSANSEAVCQTFKQCGWYENACVHYDNTCSENTTKQACFTAFAAGVRCGWYDEACRSYNPICSENKTVESCRTAATRSNYCKWYEDTNYPSRTGCYAAFSTRESCPYSGFTLTCQAGEVLSYNANVVTCIPCPVGQVPGATAAAGGLYKRPFSLMCENSTSGSQLSVPKCKYKDGDWEYCTSDKYTSCVSEEVAGVESARKVTFHVYPAEDSEGDKVEPGNMVNVEEEGTQTKCFLDKDYFKSADDSIKNWRLLLEGWNDVREDGTCPENDGSGSYNATDKITDPKSTGGLLATFKKIGYTAVFYYKANDNSYKYMGKDDWNVMEERYNVHDTLSEYDISEVYVFWTPKQYCVGYIGGVDTCTGTQYCYYGEECKVRKAVTQEGFKCDLRAGTYVLMWRDTDTNVYYQSGDLLPDIVKEQGIEYTSSPTGCNGVPGVTLYTHVTTCKTGYYCPGGDDGETYKCKAGATTEAVGAVSETQCYLSSGEKGTQFCDKDGKNCFWLDFSSKVYRTTSNK